MREWYTMKKTAEKAGEILIYDHIGAQFFNEDAVTASKFDADLKALGKVETILLRVNSPGGNVMDGVAIFNMLDKHEAKITARVDGIAASAASLIVMAADEITMPENSFMLIHEPRGIAMGTADDAKALARDLEAMTETFAATYSKRAKAKVDDVKALMKEDRLMTASEAVKLGYADKTGDKVAMKATWKLDLLPKQARDPVAKMILESEPPAPDNQQQQQQDNQHQNNNEPPSNVVALNTARTEAKRDTMAYVAEVHELCAMAGLPQMAKDFIAAEKSVADIRKALLDAKATADLTAQTANQITQHQNQNTSAVATAGWKKATAAVNKRIEAIQKPFG